MSVEVTINYDQLIFSNFWDKGDEILVKLILHILNQPVLQYVCW